MPLPTISQNTFKASSGILFAGLFLYLLLRSWSVAPLHDETSTYMHYVETGAIFGPEAFADANNHYLNSLWCRAMYLLAGNNLFLFRLANVLAFIPYFMAVFSLSEELKHYGKRLLFIAALTTVPYLLDYFSAARGYGLGIGFFMAALAALRQWILTRQTGWLIVTCLTIFLSVFANLTFIVSALLLIVYVLFFLFYEFRKMTPKAIAIQAGCMLILIAALVPLIQHGMFLKDIGALYYGSLDGFWNVTGKTLSILVLFRDDYLLKWIYIAFALVVSVIVLATWKREGLKRISGNTLFLCVFFIAGNAAAVLFMAKVMLVNYPEDRAGMYFVPLGIGAFAYVLLHHSYWKYTAILTCFFPATFLWKMNLHTSVFSPDDRITYDFYTQVVRHLKPGDVLAIDPIQQLNWARWEQLNRHKRPHPGYVTRTFFDNYDVIVTKTAFLLPDSIQSHYHVIARDPSANYIAWKRNYPLTQIPVLSGTIPDYTGNEERILLFTIPITDSLRHQLFRIDWSGTLQTSEPYRDMVLLTETYDSTQLVKRTASFNFRWYMGIHKRQFDYTFHYGGQPFTNDEAELKVYIWNLEKRFVRCRNGKYKWSLLKNNNNGTR